jgi:multiple sugar transport system substrate-binding protein
VLTMGGSGDGLQLGGFMKRLFGRYGRVKVLALFVTAGTLAASAALVPFQAGASSSAIHLTLWQQWGSSGPNAVALNAAIKQYETLHPNVTITSTYITNDAKILAAISGGNPPDLIDLGTSIQVGGWAAAGALLPLNSYIKASGLKMSAYVPAAVSAVTEGGNIYGLPFQDFNAGLLYNKKLFAAAGLNPNKPPTTTAQLYSDAVRLTKVNSSGAITQAGFLPAWPGVANGQTSTLESLGWVFGGSWTSGSQPTATNPGNLAALKWEDSFYKKFGAEKMAAFQSSAGAYLTATDPFFSGKLAMTFDGPWVLAFMKSASPKMVANIGAEPFPAPPGKPQLAGSTFLDTNPQVIPRGSSNPQAAFNFIKWETTNSALSTSFANTVFNVPQLVGAKSPSYAGASIFENEAKSSNAHSWNQSCYSSTYQLDLSNEESQVVLGKATPSSALKDLQQSALSAKSSCP